MTSRRAFLPGAAALAALILVGCSDNSGLPKRYPVSGTITYNGKPLETGTVMFEPNDLTTGRVASGVIENGSYSLSTTGEDSGALPGDYKVAVLAKKVDMTKVNADAQAHGGAGRHDDIAKAEKKAEHLAPKKYERTDTSGLTAKVEEKSNRINFDLTD